ncbi:peptide-methionine (S)-S-oxide reductase [Arachidicoccus ginsenosidimutans]|uniref:peptide-methionine (S)-S-oxide reductase MsrA n=1 Tax=Arachidicoccus sp. BS20 TaxID=1850526 RepID=UPI0007F10805|nr:peptide-methionine (S)-S-oxide reductase MsrA [Arachidicoccus sp. BS20]ANI88463.1 peptide-methionine (S)-S-oxide reductase [Arachidicoccus sp. BS20]
MTTRLITSTVLCFALLTSCVEQKNHQKNMDEKFSDSIAISDNVDTATFGTGCFWCTEAIFQRLKGVEKVVSGYSGGTIPNPTYEEVCTGTTGYAEVCQIFYNPSEISFDELLKVFWQTHDPTTLNRQGNDVGPQYRSVVFFHNEEQKNKAEKYKTELNKSGAWANPVVTAIEPYSNFYSAENYHQNYYNNNPRQMYCQYVIKPKLEKFEKVFKNELK